MADNRHRLRLGLRAIRVGLFGASLLLSVFSLVLWVRSYRWEDDLWVRHSDAMTTVGTTPGKMWLLVESGYSPTPRMDWGMKMERINEFRWGYVLSGFVYTTELRPLTVAIPFWFLSPLCLAATVVFWPGNRRHFSLRLPRS